MVVIGCPQGASPALTQIREEVVRGECSGAARGMLTPLPLRTNVKSPSEDVRSIQHCASYASQLAYALIGVY